MQANDMNGREIIMPDQDETELLKLIRSGDFDKIIINLKDKKMSSLALVKEHSTKKKIVELLKESSFQEIAVKSHNGKITRLQNTVKVLFSK